MVFFTVAGSQTTILPCPTLTEYHARLSYLSYFLGDVASLKLRLSPPNTLLSLMVMVLVLSKVASRRHCCLWQDCRGLCPPKSHHLGTLHPGNEARDIKRVARKTVATSFIAVPIKNRKDPRGFSVQVQEIIDPHVLLGHLVTTTGICIEDADVQQFWHHVRVTAPQPCYVASPASSSHIPVSIYGDGAKLTTDAGKMVGIYLGLPLWRPRSTRCARWCIWSCEEKLFYRHHTLNRIFRRIAWSLNKAWEGAGDRLWALTEFKGDWQFHKFTIRFASSWQRLDNVCWRCRAGVNSCWFNYWDDDPGWEELSLTDFIVEQLGSQDVFPLLLARGFHPGIVKACSMHAVHLGLQYDINGSGLLHGLMFFYRGWCGFFFVGVKKRREACSE